jgi:ribosome-associated toxin RatA of RatAB toxin-antitoxin module
VPIHAAFALAGRVADYPQWSDRIASAETTDDTHATFDIRIHGVQRTIEIEMTEVHPEWRVEWEAIEGPEHGGMLTFHELAPSLTHVELTIDLEPESPVQRLTRSFHLPERALRGELHRFKAWSELWQEVEDIEPPEPDVPPEDEFEEEPEEDLEDDEDEDDEDDLDEEEEEDELDEGPEDEFDEEELEEEPEDEFEDSEEEGMDEEGEPAGTR